MAHRLLGRLTRIGAVTAVALVAAALGVPAGSAQAAAQGAHLVGISSPTTGSFTPSGSGDVTDEEFMGEPDDADAGPDPYPGVISDRSNGSGHGSGNGPS